MAQNWSRHWLLMVGVSLSTLCGTAAWADAAPPAAPAVGDPGEIVVTAQRREQSASAVPMSIQAFSGAELQRLRVTDLQDLQSIVPSFTVTPTAQGVPNYFLRGIGFNTINASASSTVGTYVDEVAYPYPVMNSGPIFDLARVEVLKGPQGTLFGRNTTAGLIDFVTAKPTRDVQAYVTAEGGNNATHNFEGALSGPITDWLQGRIAFRTEDSDEGWQKSFTRDERLGQVHKYGVRVAIAAQPTDRLTIDLSYNFWYNRSDTLAGQMVAFAPTAVPGSGSEAAYNVPGLAEFFAAHQPHSATYADWAPFAERAANEGTPGQPGNAPGVSLPLAEDTQFHAGKLKLDEELGDKLHLISLTGYSKLIRHALSDISGAPFEIELFEPRDRISSINQELRLEGRTSFVNWLVGGYYAHDKVQDDDIPHTGDLGTARALRAASESLVDTPYNVTGYTVAEASTTFREYVDEGAFRTTTKSVFANGDWRFSSKLGLTTGIRYTEDRQQYVGCTADYLGNLLPHINLFNRYNWSHLASANGVPPAPISEGQCGSYIQSTNSFGAAVSDLKEHNVAFRVAANWTPTSDLLFYASISRGAKSADTPVTGATNAEQNKPAKQEILLAYEAGFKAHVFDGHVQANASFFYYDYKDKQAVANFKDPVYTVLTQLQNIPKSEAYGIDGDVTWHMTRRLSATLSGTWLKTKILKWETIDDTGNPIDLAGEGFAYAPKFSGSANLEYDQPINDRLGVTADVNGRYQSKSNATSERDPLYAIKAYGTVNASLGLYSTPGKWRAQAWVRNLTNTYYWTQVISNSNTIVRFPGQTRTFGLTLTKNL